MISTIAIFTELMKTRGAQQEWELTSFVHDDLNHFCRWSFSKPGEKPIHATISDAEIEWNVTRSQMVDVVLARFDVALVTARNQSQN